MSAAYIPIELRNRVAEQAQHRCGYCLTSEAVIGSPMEIEHIIPEARGGSTEEDNLWLACWQCNRRKGTRIAAVDPRTGDTAPLFDPRHQSWPEHFVWTTAGDRIEGLTPTGRAIVDALDLDRELLVSARRDWVIMRRHPPRD